MLLASSLSFARLWVHSVWLHSRGRGGVTFPGLHVHSPVTEHRLLGLCSFQSKIHRGTVPPSGEKNIYKHLPPQENKLFLSFF